MNPSSEMQPWDNFIKKSTMLLGGSKTINPVQNPSYGVESNWNFSGDRALSNLRSDYTYRQAGMEGKRRMEANISEGKPAMAVRR